MIQRVLFIPTNKWTCWGGSEKLWVELASHFIQEKGFHVGILIKKWDTLHPELLKLFGKAKVFEHQTSANRFFTVFQSLWTRIYSNNSQERLFSKVIDSFKPTIVIISQAANHDGLEFMEMCVKHRLPFNTISQAASEAMWPSPSLSGRLAEVFTKARLNMFVSVDNRRLTELQLTTRLDNAVVVRNPFNVDFHSTLQFPRDIDQICIACVARLELHAKGQDILLEVLSDPKWRRRDLHLRLYGNGADKKSIENLIRLFGISKSVTVEGYFDTTEIWMQNHALILPSRYEGLPLALVEAMLCSRFGIVTNVSGNAEIIIDNVNGFIAAAPRAEYIDEALERAWMRRSEWEAIGIAAQAYVKSIIPPDPICQVAEVLMKSIR